MKKARGEGIPVWESTEGWLYLDLDCYFQRFPGEPRK